MHKLVPTTRPRAWAYVVLGATITTAFTLAGIRITQAATGGLDLGRAWNTACSVGALTGLVTVGMLAWWISARCSQAAAGESAAKTAAEMTDIRDQLQQTKEQLASLENQAWWGTQPAEVDPEATVELGSNVVPIRRGRLPHAKGSAG